MPLAGRIRKASTLSQKSFSSPASGPPESILLDQIEPALEAQFILRTSESVLEVQFEYALRRPSQLSGRQ